ncbi:MAG TPA: GNAT family N-acetyltransferase [Candidatus Bathyarchaeia archaeon]|nr:GNAT family N-acetyltransferase [Candidatus Bathyarchaeia archaeon]
MKETKNRLILIDGLPGSGKSTTAQFLSYQLEKNGVNARWFHEFDTRNPLFNENEIERKSISNAEEFIKITLNKWQKLVDELNATNEVYIIESYLMQCTAGYLFENNVRNELILDYITEVYKIIKPLNPILIYMTSKDVNHAITRLKKLRGNDWVDSHVEMDQNLPYILANNLKGFDGWVQMFSDYKEISDEIYQTFNYKKIAIDYAEDNWELYRQIILSFLALDFFPRMELPDLEKYIGAFEPASSKYFFSIIKQNNNLLLCDYFNTNLRLITVKKNEFVAESTPHIFRFEEDNGLFSKIIYDCSGIYQGSICEFRKIPNQQLIQSKKTNQVLRIAQKTPKELSEKEWTEFFDIETQIFKEMYPVDDPLPNFELMKKVMLNPIDLYDHIFWYIYEPFDNKMIGYGKLSYNSPKNPDYYRSKHKCEAHIFISKDYRRMGIATELLKIIVGKAKEIGKTILQTDVYLDSTVDFLKKILDAKPAKIGDEKRLYFDKLDWDEMQRWVNEGKQRAKGVTTKIYTNIPDEILQEYCDLFTAVAEDEPSGELEETFTLTPEMHRKYMKEYDERKMIIFSVLAIEEDGTISAMTEIYYDTNRNIVGSQGFTAVKKEFRGRGLAKWIKAAMLLHLRENYPTIKYFRTGNASANLPMLSINERLGFKLIFHRYDFNLNIEEIEKKLYFRK